MVVFLVFCTQSKMLRGYPIPSSFPCQARQPLFHRGANFAASPRPWSAEKAALRAGRGGPKYRHPGKMSHVEVM
jgi:hypothetical protein